MKLENITKAFQDIDKHTLNEVAVKELKQLTDDGVNVKIANENLYDRIVNTVDKRRVVLERKSDILSKLYGDGLLCKDLTLDQQNDFYPYQLLKNSAIGGLVGYTAYTSVVNKAPFLKAPGLLLSIGGIHAISRHYYNNMLEKRIETPWKIHIHRVSKGLGPTNFAGNDNYKNFYGTNQRWEAYLNEQTPDYLYNEKKNRFNEVSIYKQFNTSKVNINPFFSNYDKQRMLGKVEIYDKNSTRYYFDEDTKFKERNHPEEYLLKYANGEDVSKDTKYDGEIQEEKEFKKLREASYRNDNVLKPQTFLSYETFEPNDASEVGENRVINYKNNYDNVLEFASASTGMPSYAETYLKFLNFNTEHSDKFIFDWGMNLKLNLLKRKIHFLRNQGIEEEEIRQIINEFNSNSSKEKEEFFKKNIQIYEEHSIPSYLIHSEKEENHMKKFSNFSKNFKVNLLKNNNDDSIDFDFPIDEANYDPWQEYKAIYSDLMKNGRKYYIVQSLPEWKFLLTRKPRYHVNESYNPEIPHLPNMRDSIFHILSLERFHRERWRKENRFHQENTTHAI